MSHKTLLALSPLGLCLLAGSAHADLSPYSLGASEQMTHHTNVFRAPEGHQQSDWLSTTQVTGGLDQQLGRDRLRADAAFNVNRYLNLSGGNTNGFTLDGAFDWTAPADLSGDLGASASRRQYFYGLSGDTPSQRTNMETDKRVYADFQLGGPSRWQIFTGGSANSRDYSDPGFAPNEERQWSWNGGTRYSTSPDLTFGLVGAYTSGRYPHAVVGTGAQDFSLRSADFTVKLQASGASSLDARVGYTSYRSSGQSTRNFVNAGLNWDWAPPSRFTVHVGLSRDADDDASMGAIASTANLTGRSINNTARVNTDYALSAKITLNAGAQYTVRHYSNALVPVVDPTTGSIAGFQSVSGDNRTSYFTLGANYQPTRTVKLGCSYAHENRHADSGVFSITPSYSDNVISCSAGIELK